MNRENANGEEAQIDRNLAMEAVRVTEAAAIAANRLMGGGDEKAADQAAVAGKSGRHRARKRPQKE